MNKRRVSEQKIAYARIAAFKLNRIQLYVSALCIFAWILTIFIWAIPNGVAFAPADYGGLLKEPIVFDLITTIIPILWFFLPSLILDFRAKDRLTSPKQIKRYSVAMLCVPPFGTFAGILLLYFRLRKDEILNSKTTGFLNNIFSKPNFFTQLFEDIFARKTAQKRSNKKYPKVELMFYLSVLLNPKKLAQVNYALYDPHANKIAVDSKDVKKTLSSYLNLHADSTNLPKDVLEEKKQTEESAQEVNNENDVKRNMKLAKIKEKQERKLFKQREKLAHKSASNIESALQRNFQNTNNIQEEVNSSPVQGNSPANNFLSRKEMKILEKQHKREQKEKEKAFKLKEKAFRNNGGIQQ